MLFASSRMLSNLHPSQQDGFVKLLLEIDAGLPLSFHELFKSPAG